MEGQVQYLWNIYDYGTKDQIEFWFDEPGYYGALRCQWSSKESTDSIGPFCGILIGLACSFSSILNGCNIWYDSEISTTPLIYQFLQIGPNFMQPVTSTDPPIKDITFMACNGCYINF